MNKAQGRQHSPSLSGLGRTIRFMLTATVAGAIGLLGVLVGQVFVRGRELRDMRREAYIAWIRAVRLLPTWDGPPPAAGSTIEMPSDARKMALNLATTDLEVVASRRVLKAAAAYRAALDGPEANQAFSTPTIAAWVDHFDRAMRTHRKAVLLAMRRDLFPWWMRGEALVS